MKTLSLDPDVQVAIEKVTCLVYGGKPGNKWEQRRVVLSLLQRGCDAIQRQYGEYPQGVGGFRRFPSVLEFREPTPDEVAADKMVEEFYENTGTPGRFKYWQEHVAREVVKADVVAGIVKRLQGGAQ